MRQRKSYEYSCPWAFGSKPYDSSPVKQRLGAVVFLFFLKAMTSWYWTHHHQTSQTVICHNHGTGFLGLNPSESIVSGCDGTPESWSEAWTNERSMEPSLNHEAFKAFVGKQPKTVFSIFFPSIVISFFSYFWIPECRRRQHPLLKILVCGIIAVVIRIQLRTPHWHLKFELRFELVIGIAQL